MKLNICSQVSDFTIEDEIDAADGIDRDNIISKVSDCLYDLINDVIYDSFSNIPLSQKSQGFFPDPCTIGDDLCDQIIKYCDTIYGKRMRITVCDDIGNIVVEEYVEVSEVIDYVDYIEDEFGREMHDIYVGKIVLIMLKNFLKYGVWHFGLRRDDGAILTDIRRWPEPVKKGREFIWQDSIGLLEPVLWFGLKDEAPLDCWTLDKSPGRYDILEVNDNPCGGKISVVERWNTFWFGTFWILDWDALFDNNGDSCIVWMFAECGMNEPEEEFYAVRDSCPIKLDAKDRSANMILKIDEFFCQQKCYVKISEKT